MGDATVIDADASTTSLMEAVGAAPPGVVILHATGSAAPDPADPHSLLLLLDLLASPAHLVIAAADPGPDPVQPLLLASDLVVAHPDARFARAAPAAALALAPALQDRAGHGALWHWLLEPLGITATTARGLALVDELAPAPLPVALRRAESALAWERDRPGAVTEVKALLRTSSGTEGSERSRRARLVTDAIERLGTEHTPGAGTS